MTKIFLSMSLCSMITLAQAAMHTQLATTKAQVVKENSPTFELTLPSNPTTGYRWFLMRYNSKLITPISQRYVAPKAVKPGIGGEEVWTFKAKSAAFSVPQLIAITMTYAQPWELDKQEVKTFTVVTDPKD